MRLHFQVVIQGSSHAYHPKNKCACGWHRLLLQVIKVIGTAGTHLLLQWTCMRRTARNISIKSKPDNYSVDIHFVKIRPHLKTWSLHCTVLLKKEEVFHTKFTETATFNSLTIQSMDFLYFQHICIKLSIYIFHFREWLHSQEAKGITCAYVF